MFGVMLLSFVRGIIRTVYNYFVVAGVECLRQGWISGGGLSCMCAVCVLACESVRVSQVLVILLLSPLVLAVTPQLLHPRFRCFSI